MQDIRPDIIEISSAIREMSQGINNISVTSKQISALREEVLADIANKAREVISLSDSQAKDAQETLPLFSAIGAAIGITSESMDTLASVAGEMFQLVINLKIEGAHLQGTSRTAGIGRGIDVIADAAQKLLDLCNETASRNQKIFKETKNNVDKLSSKVQGFVEASEKIADKMKGKLEEIEAGTEIKEYDDQITNALIEESAAAKQITESIENINNKLNTPIEVAA